MKNVFLIIFLVLSLNSFGQYQHFKLKIEDNSKFKFEAYQEIKEQLGNKGWGAWEKISYNFVLQDFKTIKDHVTFQVCYNNKFTNIFADSLDTDSNYSVCFPVKFNIVTESLQIESVPKLALQNFKLFDRKAAYFEDYFTMENFILRDLNGFFSAYKMYRLKTKADFVIQFNEDFFGVENALIVTENSVFLGDFDGDSNLKELHEVKDFKFKPSVLSNFPEISDLEIYQSSHVAFNKRLKVTEIYQDLKGFAMFFEDTLYDFNINFMINRIDF